MPAAYTPSAPTGKGTDDYRCFLLDPGLEDDAFLTGIDVLPGNPEVVHHVILFQVPPERVEEAKRVDAGTEGEGWSHPVYTVTPGVPGDSGSAFLDAEGNALGTLSTLALAPLAGSNGVGDLAHELAYAQATSGIAGLRLVPGTEPFSPIL